MNPSTHSGGQSIENPTTPSTTDNSERLKQQQRLTPHSNGVTSTATTSTTNPNLSSSNGHEGNSSNGNNPTHPCHNRFTSSSTQTLLTSSSFPSNNGNHPSLRNFTNSQKEVLRLIGQHLQSVGLK